MSINLTTNPRGGTFTLNGAGISDADSDGKDVDLTAIDGTGYLNYVINGYHYTLADANDNALNAENADGSTISEQAARTACIYLLQLDSSGSLTTLKGTEVPVDDSDNIKEGYALHIPQPSEDKCPIGYIKVITAGDSTTFTAGTTDLDASNVTATYTDLFALPPEPVS